jgi:transposase
MARLLSMDLRERVVAAVEGGLSRRQAAARLGVTVSSAIRWLRVADPSVGAGRRERLGGGRRSERIEAHGTAIRAQVAEKPDMTLAELRAWLRAEHGMWVSISGLWRFFDRHGPSLNRKSAHAAEQDRPDILRRRVKSGPCWMNAVGVR